jgi:hypothetical protein
MYLIKTDEHGLKIFIKKNTDTVVSFGENPANTDYQIFKKEVLAGAELQDADGNVMTQEQANEFIASLP